MSMASNQAPRAETRWTGSNRGGWSNAAFDTALDAYNTTLAKDDRTRHLAEMARIVSDEVAAISLYYDLGAVAGVASLRGPGPAAPGTSGLIGWNVQDWSFQ
jgi:ABC-type transport system substrate-binding protein